MNSNFPKRLIEVAFPLKQTSLDSVHEKNVRHGHISTLHIWPARRPLAACRAALITTLLPDPGDPVKRKEILDRLAGKVVQKVKRKKTDTGWEEEVSEETEGGILHWGRESGPDLEWFREKIREAYGGRAPRVLDPFAGGGAIPLEAMRLGCEATAVDINPVAWFILKCTLEYPQRLAGQKRPLPDFALQDRDFMRDYLKAQGFTGKELDLELEKLDFGKAAQPALFSSPLATTWRGAGGEVEADLAWHVRAWGRWVLKEARKELAPYYPTYADFEPLVEGTGKVEQRPMTLVPLKEDGTADIDVLNAEFTPGYLAEKRNPRWVAKPTVAYLWARTVTCKNCRATIPLLKTRWLCKKDKKLTVLNIEPNKEKSGVIFSIQNKITNVGKLSLEMEVNNKQIGNGTMSKSGARCPCCNSIMTMEYIRLEGKADRLGQVLTVCIVDGHSGKEYRLPTDFELSSFSETIELIENIYSQIPFGLPTEDTPGPAGSKMNSSSLRIYGFYKWIDIFLSRQLVGLGSFLIETRNSFRDIEAQYTDLSWQTSLKAYLCLVLSRMTDRSSTICHWSLTGEKIQNTFSRFALPISWDFSETNLIASSSGTYDGQVEWIAEVIEHCTKAQLYPGTSSEVLQLSSTSLPIDKKWDIVITDPPYYDAIPYSDLMDFFYVWERRVLRGINEQFDKIFNDPLTPKWNYEKQDGELIDNPVRFDNNKKKSKIVYEEGMSKVFQATNYCLVDDGRLVIVFASKNPSAWETLVSAIIRSGFVVDGSWPIQTEMINRTRAISAAALATSVWLVCKKRSPSARSGWDTRVLDEMRHKIKVQLRNFWDAGIRGPDFVWAATGPALEAYSQYPVVKKANHPGEVMAVGEFLAQVRRMVVDFVVGRVLTGDGGEEVTGLDNVTTYYLLHRHDFGLNDAPAGPCILYAVSCGLSDKDLADRYDLLARRGGKAQEELEEDEGDEEEGETQGSGSVFRLKAWNQRKNPRMGYDPVTDSFIERLPLFPDLEREAQPGREIPLIDQVHRLMQLWKGGDVSKVNEYLDMRGLRRNPLFHQLLQALIELAPAGSEERSLMESISNHVSEKKLPSQMSF